MNSIKSILLGLLVGAISYGLVYHFGSKNEVESAISASVSPIALVTKIVQHSANIGAKIFKTPIPKFTPVPYTTITPSKSPSPSPTSSIISSPTPSPRPIPSASVTPVPTSTPTQTPTPSSQFIPGSVIINEIAWMGTENSSSDEWIELYNPGAVSVDLTGWKLLIAGDNAILLSGTIESGGYYLMERTDDTPVNDVAADYTGPFGHYGLSDAGEHLTLADGSGNSVDDIDCSTGWFAGVKDKGAKASMERVDRSRWATNNGSVTIGHDASGTPILGTPRGKNSATP